MYQQTLHVVKVWYPTSTNVYKPLIRPGQCVEHGGPNGQRLIVQKLELRFRGEYLISMHVVKGTCNSHQFY